jgi:hypothetical protein
MPVQTRNMVRRLIIENTKKCSSTIDFDEASNAWRQNKNVLPNGCFSYKEPSPLLTKKKVKK